MKKYACLMMLTICVSALADMDTNTIYNQSTCTLQHLNTILSNTPTHSATHNIPPSSSGTLVNTISPGAYAEDTYAVYCPEKATNFIVFMYDGDNQATYFFYSGITVESSGSELTLTDAS